MLKIRLQRHGSKGNPVYRLVVAESAHPRDGRFVEILGHYAPKSRGQDPEFKINVERAEYWISKGAQPSDTAKSLIRQAKKLGVNEGIAIAPAAINPVAAAA